MTRQFVIVAALFVAAAAVNAQQFPPGKWWRGEAVVRQLELTNAQQDRLDKVFRAASNDLINASVEVEKLQLALRGEIDRPQLRRQEIQRVAARLSEARGRMFGREMMMLVDMRAVLTDVQWKRMRLLLERAESRQLPQRRPQ